VVPEKRRTLQALNVANVSLVDERPVVSRLFEWWIYSNLITMGWRREKGIFRKKSYVDTRAVDMALQGAVQVFVGLGAGRPNIALRVLADMFTNNPRNEESTNGLIEWLTKESESETDAHPKLPPWKAILQDHRMEEAGSEIRWEQLGDAQLRGIFFSFGAQGLMWGLNHPDLMGPLFESAKAIRGLRWILSTNHARTSLRALRLRGHHYLATYPPCWPKR
jgi:hypothetical protein